MLGEDVVLVGVSKAIKYQENPFLDQDTFKIEKGMKTVIAGKTSDMLINMDTGETEGITMLHKYKEVDRDMFIKLYIGEISSLFDLSKTGLKVFGFVLQCLPINRATIYLNISDVMKYCGYKTTKQAYKGLSELVANKIIALSDKPNLWFINPMIVFNGDRIAFIKEYRLKDIPKQKQIPNLLPGL